jgi:hypothetical protein
MKPYEQWGLGGMYPTVRSTLRSWLATCRPPAGARERLLAAARTMPTRRPWRGRVRWPANSPHWGQEHWDWGYDERQTALLWLRVNPTFLRLFA